MISDNQIQQLKSENELLQIQLLDVNEMIKVREEELDLLRKTAAHAVLLQSQLDLNLGEFEQMQLHIHKEKRVAESALKREATLEEEVFQSIRMETAFYNMQDEFASTKAALADINNELAQSASLYRQVADLKARIAELESNLEIAALENTFMKEELDNSRREQESGTKKKEG